METMTIKAVNKAGTGFMAEGHDSWFNISKGADISFKELTKGMTISVDANDKWVKSYTKVAGAVAAAQAPSAAKQTATYSDDTQNRIARGNATNAVLGSSEIIKAITEQSGSPAETIQLTKNLVEVFANYISTGKFVEVSA